MNIGIDARPLKMKTTGIGLYIINLVNYLTNQEGIRCILFADEEIEGPFSEANRASLKVVTFSAGRRFTWEQFSLPRYLAEEKIDVYHATWNYGLPFRIACPAVVTVHDLIPLALTLRRLSLKERMVSRNIYQFSLRLSVKKAAKVITDSHNSKCDIMKFLGVDAEKIVVINPGVGSNYRPVEDERLIEKCKERYAVSGEYILYAGGFDLRKNISSLMEAYSRVCSLKSRDIKLVVVGEKNFLYPSLQRKVEELKVVNRVIFTDYVPEEDMPLLLSGAKMLVYPSFYEGFGLPLLEAMACGTPIITSDVSSLPEVVGDTGLLVNPHSVESIADAMKELLEDSSLCQRLVRRGLERAKHFSWAENARRTLAVYKEVLAEL